eukprot:bmy_06086T0
MAANFVKESNWVTGDRGGAEQRAGGRRASLGSVRALLKPGAWKLNQRQDISAWLAPWFPKAPAESVVTLKIPIKVELAAGKTYRSYVCGHSKKQPFCDGSHFFQLTGLSPLKFKAQETRMVALCTCETTQQPPYCEETHKSEQVQSLWVPHSEGMGAARPKKGSPQEPQYP